MHVPDAPATAPGVVDEALPSVAVVIPTSRGGADLETCLVSLAAQGYADLDVIVVDNGSSDPLIEDLPDRFLGVRVLRNEENRGFVGACNQGIEAASGELILLLNDDTALEPGALSAMLGALARHPSWGACQAKLLLMDDPTRLDTAGSFLTATGFLVHRGAFGSEKEFTASDEIFAAKGACLLVRRPALAEVGGFDPDFFAYFEETDLCWRLWLAGWEVGFAADARVLHKLGATAAALPTAFVQFHSFKNRICTLVKNLGPARLAWMLPYHVALCVCVASWYSLRGRARLGRAILRALGWNMIHLPDTLRKRRRVQRARRLPDRVLMRRILRPTPLRTLLHYARGTAWNPTVD
jgi:GT2 family glycosyltransferase